MNFTANTQLHVRAHPIALYFDRASDEVAKTFLQKYCQHLHFLHVHGLAKPGERLRRRYTTHKLSIYALVFWGHSKSTSAAPVGRHHMQQSLARTLRRVAYAKCSETHFSAAHWKTNGRFATPQYLTLLSRTRCWPAHARASTRTYTAATNFVQYR